MGSDSRQTGARAGSGLIPLVICLLVAGRALAAPPQVFVDVRGSCPEAGQLRRHLGDQVDYVSSSRGAWRIQTRRGTDGKLSLRLVDPSGTRSLVRPLESQSCEVLAEAVAIIVLTHFVKLRLVPPSILAPASSRPVRPPPPSPPWSPRISAGVAGGIELAFGPQLSAGSGQLDLALQPWRPPLLARIVAGVTAPTTQTTPTDDVERLQAVFRLDAAWRWEHRRWWLQPALGAGVVLGRVVALDLEGQPAATRAHLACGLALAGGIPVHQLLSLRLEATLHLFPIRDRYLIEPVGEVARMPVCSVTLGLGIQLDRNL